MPRVPNTPDDANGRSPLTALGELGFAAVADGELAGLLQMIEHELGIRGWRPRREWIRPESGLELPDGVTAEQS